MSTTHPRPLPEGGEGAFSQSLEQVLAELENTIALLADGAAPLEELVVAHQRAAGLLSEADRRLDVLRARADRLVSSLK